MVRKKHVTEDPDFSLIGAIREVIREEFTRDPDHRNNPKLRAKAIVEEVEKRHPQFEINRGSANVAIVKVRKELGISESYSAKPREGYTEETLLLARKLVELSGGFAPARGILDLLEKIT